jgi:hypothetical protein
VWVNREDNKGSGTERHGYKLSLAKILEIKGDTVYLQWLFLYDEVDVKIREESNMKEQEVFMTSQKIYQQRVHKDCLVGVAEVRAYSSSTMGLCWDRLIYFTKNSHFVVRCVTGSDVDSEYNTDSEGLISSTDEEGRIPNKRARLYDLGRGKKRKR